LEKAARAETLFDALYELDEKTMNDPTAPRLGKLFQKYLTDRTVVLEGQNGSAKLRKVEADKNNDGNKYEVVLLG
jgi:hypothetical protein